MISKGIQGNRRTHNGLVQWPCWASRADSGCNTYLSWFVDRLQSSFCDMNSE